MFSDILTKLRKDKNLTQEQLAKLINVDRSSVGKYESTNVIPSLEVLKRISQVFNVSLDYLLQKDESKSPVYDDETLETLEQLKNDKDLRTLFDLAKTAKKADLIATHQLLKALKERENNHDY